MTGQAFVPDLNLLKKYKYNAYRDEELKRTMIEVDILNE
jgi:hypothetical protein